MDVIRHFSRYQIIERHQIADRKGSDVSRAMHANRHKDISPHSWNIIISSVTSLLKIGR